MLKQLKLHPSGQNPARDRRLVCIYDTTNVRSIIVSPKKRRTNAGSGGRCRSQTENIPSTRLKARQGTNQQTRLSLPLLKKGQGKDESASG
jgi:hypothetical protein